MEKKQCTRCLQVKPYEEYYRKHTHATGRASECKECARKEMRERAQGLYDPVRYTKREKSYKDYLEDAGLTKYYKRTLKYMI